MKQTIQLDLAQLDVLSKHGSPTPGLHLELTAAFHEEKLKSKLH